MAYDNARQRERLNEQARTDDLTGLFNRRHFHERLGAELARTRRSGDPVALVLLDVDDFKAVNDAHGHPVGDGVLRAFADLVRETVRGADIVCRTGGEEFAVILPGADEDEAVTAAHRLVERGPRGLPRAGGRADRVGRAGDRAAGGRHGRRAVPDGRRPPAGGQGRRQGPRGHRPLKRPCAVERPRARRR